ncbi:hypothetical protein BG005_003533, partial [Podila minutissima]
MDNEPPVFQKFKSKDGKRLQSLPTHVLDVDGGRYVLWSDIELAFKGIESLNHRLPLCIKYSEYAYHVVLSDEQAQEAEGSHN